MQHNRENCGMDIRSGMHMVTWHFLPMFLQSPNIIWFIFQCSQQKSPVGMAYTNIGDSDDISHQIPFMNLCPFKKSNKVTENLTLIDRRNFDLLRVMDTYTLTASSWMYVGFLQTITSALNIYSTFTFSWWITALLLTDPSLLCWHLERDIQRTADSWHCDVLHLAPYEQSHFWRSWDLSHHCQFESLWDSDMFLSALSSSSENFRTFL